MVSVSHKKTGNMDKFHTYGYHSFRVVDLEKLRTSGRTATKRLTEHFHTKLHQEKWLQWHVDHGYNH